MENKRIRVLQVVKALGVGGLETVAMNCVRYADPEKYQMDFMLYGDDHGEYEAEAEALGCRLIRVAPPKAGYIKHYKSICAALKEYGPFDVVHAHTYFNAGIVMRAAKRAGVPARIAHSHSMRRDADNRFDKRIYAAIMRSWINRYATRICACSRAAGDNVFGSAAFSDHGIIVPNIVRLGDFAFSEAVRNDMRDALRIPRGAVVLGQVGHLNGVKNQSLLLRAAAEYEYRGEAPYVLLVGDGENMEKLRSEAEALGIMTRVRFTGTRTDVGALLCAMDAFVCTSRHEGFGIVMLEAQANGLPVVVHSHALVDEIKNLGDCVAVDEYDDLNKWRAGFDAALARGRSEAAVAALAASEYSDTGFGRVLDRIYRQG